MDSMDKKRILIVDDEVGITRGLKLYLEGTGGYDVWTVNEGGRALEAVRACHPHLILLDIAMPDADGASLAAELRDDPRFARVPVVFLTALISKVEAARAATVGGHTFLAKPVDPDAVIDCIERTLLGQQEPDDPFGEAPGVV